MTKDQREYLRQCTLAVRHIVEKGDPEFFPELTRFLMLGMKGLPGEIVLQHGYYKEGYEAGFEAGYRLGQEGLVPDEKPKPPAKKATVLKLVKKRPGGQWP